MPKSGLGQCDCRCTNWFVDASDWRDAFLMPRGLLCLLSELGLPGHFCDTGVTSGDGDLRANLQDTMAFGK